MNKALVVAVASAAAAALAGCTGAPSPGKVATEQPTHTTARVRNDAGELQRLAEALVPLGDPGVLVHVESTDEQRTDVTAGVADLATKAPLDPASHFRIGSITKMFTAAIALQLVAERRISLDQPVNEVVPDLLADSRVTIRMLLNHTSGLGDLPPGFDGPALLADPRRHVDPAGALQSAKATATSSVAPGIKQTYSNLGYVALGSVIAHVSGKDTP